MAGPDYIVDIQGLAQRQPEADRAEVRQEQPAANARPWLAIHWQCCRVYCRVYRNRDATAYDARCPTCGRHVRIPVGPGGTSNRFFQAS